MSELSTFLELSKDPGPTMPASTRALHNDVELNAHLAIQISAEEEALDAIRSGGEQAALDALRRWALAKDAFPEVLNAAINRTSEQP